MENFPKTSNKLAVFENVIPKGKPKTKGFFGKAFFEDSLSPSESDLMIDERDTFAKKRRSIPVKVHEEPLNLICKWKDCGISFKVYHDFISHLECHITSSASTSDVLGEEMPCPWEKCEHGLIQSTALRRHIYYHGYITRLMNLGDNVTERNKLPACNQDFSLDIPIVSGIYSCEWEDCFAVFETIYHFIQHVDIHVKNNPKSCKEGDIKCAWKNCPQSSRFYKIQRDLNDHIKSHTMEKRIACSACGNSFSCRTKFIDHRKRQLPIELQSYQCSQCSKLFPTERLLRDHMRSHINHYKCSYCDMTCNKPSLLSLHMRHRHLNIRHFKCNLCEHSAVTKQNLEQHLITHCEQKLLACDECDFRCRSMYGLDKHYQKEHNQGWVQTYECHCCKKTFSRGERLTKHLIKHHDFHWPSGHSRFRYKEDQDGVFRLQTVRYESLEVTEQILNKKTNPIPLNNGKAYKYNLRKRNPRETGPEFNLCIEEDHDSKQLESKSEGGAKRKRNNIVITIEDVDEDGKIVKSEVLQSEEIISDVTPSEAKVLKLANPADTFESSRAIKESKVEHDDFDKDSTFDDDMFDNASC